MLAMDGMTFVSSPVSSYRRRTVCCAYLAPALTPTVERYTVIQRSGAGIEKVHADLVVMSEDSVGCSLMTALIPAAHPSLCTRTATRTSQDSRGMEGRSFGRRGCFSHAQVLAVIGLASDGTAPAFPGQAIKPHPPQRHLTRALVCFLNAPFPHHACTLYFLHAPSERALRGVSYLQ